MMAVTASKGMPHKSEQTSNGVAVAQGATVKSRAKTDLLDGIDYPTKSLNFLTALNTTTPRPELTPVLDKSIPLSLHVLVVGAGIGGLAAAIALSLRGHSVTVVEQAPLLAEVGAGIQVPPNSSRILHDLGVTRFLAKTAVEPTTMTFRRWENGAEIGLTKLVPEFQQRFHAPYYVVHRADLHQALHDRATELNVVLKLNHRVNEYNPNTPSITLDNGQVMKADLVVAVDGIKSSARNIVSDAMVKGPQITNFAAYRATVNVEKMQKDPDTSWLLEKPCLNIWIGQDRHVMTYTIQAGKSFNMVLSHVDDSDPSTWDTRQVIPEMQREFQGWDPRLVKIISMIDKTSKWPLLTGMPQEQWVSSSGKMIILGDAAHAMLPYMSQGAAMAVEDAAALAEALSFAHTQSDVPRVLRVFEQIRYRRTSQMQKASLINGKLWHFSDGPEQEARDSASRAEVIGLPFTESANQWSDPTTQMWAYGYDAVGEITRRLRFDEHSIESSESTC